MTPLGIVLVLGGATAVIVGTLRIRAPLAAIRRLDETQTRLERYETWRGRSTDVQASGPTGADEMRALLRRRTLVLGALIGAGSVAVLAGLLLR